MYTEEQEREALRVLDECDGRVTAAMGKPGYPSRRCLHQWISEGDAAHVRKDGRPSSRYGGQTEDDAVRLLDSGMDARDMAGHPGVPNAAIARDRARAVKGEADHVDDGKTVRYGPYGGGITEAPDNSAMEGSSGRPRSESSFHRNRKGVTMGESVSMPSAYPVSYDEGRIKESLGWLSPSDYRRSLGLAA